MDVPTAIPAHDAPEADFHLQGDDQKRALDWAGDVLIAVRKHSIEDVTRACRVVAANSPECAEIAREMLQTLEEFRADVFRAMGIPA